MTRPRNRGLTRRDTTAAFIASLAKPLCAVCKYWSEGDACAHHACPGRKR